MWPMGLLFVKYFKYRQFVQIFYVLDVFLGKRCDSCWKIIFLLYIVIQSTLNFKQKPAPNCTVILFPVLFLSFDFMKCDDCLLIKLHIIFRKTTVPLFTWHKSSVGSTPEPGMSLYCPENRPLVSSWQQGSSARVWRTTLMYLCHPVLDTNGNRYVDGTNKFMV